MNRDPNLAERIGVATALEVRTTGIPYVFAPCIAVNRKECNDKLLKNFLLYRFEVVKCVPFSLMMLLITPETLIIGL